MRQLFKNFRKRIDHRVTGTKTIHAKIVQGLCIVFLSRKLVHITDLYFAFWRVFLVGMVMVWSVGAVPHTQRISKLPFPGIFGAEDVWCRNAAFTLLGALGQRRAVWDVETYIQEKKADLWLEFFCGVRKKWIRKQNNNKNELVFIFSSRNCWKVKHVTRMHIDLGFEGGCQYISRY